MTNLEKYNKAFLQTFGACDEEMAYLRTEGWDSMGHFDLITALEAAFDISICSTDVLRINSYRMGRDILLEYDVEM